MRLDNKFYIIVIVLTIILVIVIYFFYKTEMNSGIEDGNKITANSIIYDKGKKEMEFDIISKKQSIITISNNIKNYTRIIINNKSEIDHKIKIEGVTNNILEFISIVSGTTVILYKNKKWEMGVGTKNQD